MQYYNNILTVEANWLVDSGIISESNYKQLSLRKSIHVVRRGCRNTSALVAYDNLPERFKKAIQKKIGNPYNAVKRNLIEEQITHNLEYSNYFDNYKLIDGRFLPREKRREYYINAIVLEAIHQIIIKKRAKRSALGGKTTRSWDQLSEGVQELDQTRFPHTLPNNPRRLEDKYKKYRQEGLDSLIHKNFLNSNAAKIDDEVKESVIIELLADPRNLDNAQVRAFYNTLADKMNWKQITTSAVAVWREKYDVQIHAGRRGSTSFYNKKTMQVKRSAPSCPLYYWTLDGWDAELLYQQTENGRTTYHHRPTVVVVLDACCKYPVGYAVGTHETPELIQEALRNAARHTRELFGKMYRTQQLQSDHYAIKKMTPFYEGMAKHVTPARIKNAKAKIIEPYFKTINKKYCQLQPNWSGFGITAEKENQPNSEYLNKYKNNFPDFDGVCKQIQALIHAERRSKEETYKKLFRNMPEAHKIEFSHENYLMLFGETTGHKNLMQGSGLKITINGTKRDYDCFEPSFRNHASVRWEIRFDPDDLSNVLAVNEDETLRYILEEKYVQPMALIERKAGDYEQFQRINTFNSKLVQEITDFRSRTIETSRPILENLKETDTLQKLMLTDNNGQHKNRRNENRTTTGTTNIALEEEIYDMY